MSTQGADMNEINPPPLPEPAQTSYVTDSIGRSYTVRGYNSEQMQAYARAALEKDRAERGGVPDEWVPTAKNINALPRPIRSYIHAMVSNIDPAGTVRDLTIAQDTIRALEASNRVLRDACATVEGCFNASEAEGLSSALAETADEHLKDLVERRLMYSLFACQSLSAAPQPQPVHDDDLAVDKFAAAMKAKLATAREKGLEGWEECSAEFLSRRLREHVEKGDPRDVANFCMFLWSLGYGIASQPVQEAQPVLQVQQTLAPSIWCDVSESEYVAGIAEGANCRTLYTSPPHQAAQPVQREPLTDEQIDEIWKKHVLPGFGENQKFYSPHVYARDIEAAHGITKKG